MPLVNKQPFKPNPIPDNLGPDDEVFYHELTNEIFTTHDEYFERFLFCNSLTWTCARTGKSGLTFKEALDSEELDASVVKRKRKGKAKREAPPATPAAVNHEEKSCNDPEEGNGEPVKKKKKKYPYDPKKYSMPVPEGFDPSLLTPTGKIDGRKLKSKKNKDLAEELLAKCQLAQSSTGADGSPTKGRKGRRKKEDEAKKKEDETRRKEEEAKRKAQLQADLAKERELEAKRKKEAAALARQLEKQKREEEKKKAAAFLTNWEKKCEDLERDDIKRLPQPVPLSCEIPERLFGDAVFILESLFNLHELYNLSSIFPDALTYDSLEEMLFDKQPDGVLGTVIKHLLRVIFDTQPNSDGYGLNDDDPSKNATVSESAAKASSIKTENALNDAETHEHETNGLGSEHDENDDDENDDKDVNMNDLIGSAIKAAQEVKKSLPKPLPEMEITSSNLTEILRLHLLQSGSFPRGRTIYNGWYSSREDPGLWLCMQEPDLIKKLGENTVYDLEIEERIKILHTLIYQLFSFIKTRLYIEAASEQLTELRKQYRREAADFTRWDRENCVKRMQPPKRKGEQGSAVQSSEKSTNGFPEQTKTDAYQNSNSSSINGDLVDGESVNGLDNPLDHKHSNSDSKQNLKSCLKTNGSNNDALPMNDNDEIAHSKNKKITFKSQSNRSIEESNGLEDTEMGGHTSDEKVANGGGPGDDSEQLTYEEQERAYQQNMVDYEDYQRERAIRLEELNQTLSAIRLNLRNTQAIYGVHPIGRDRAYRRYWILQSLPGLFVEHEDDHVGKCLPNPTPLESQYKKLFNKENPLMHPNEADLIRSRTCETSSATNGLSAGNDDQHHRSQAPTSGAIDGDIGNNEQEQQNSAELHGGDNLRESNDFDSEGNQPISDKGNGERDDDQEDQQDQQDNEPTGISDETNFCTGDEASCAVHGLKRPSQPRWWFYHTPEAIDSLLEGLNKRGIRESELHEVLSAECSSLKQWIAQCPSYKLNKYIFEQSGIRRSRRLRVKGKGRRGRGRHCTSKM